MPMQLAPIAALVRGMDLGSPSTSQPAINNLLQMQQNTLNGLTDTIGNIGKTSRTNTVNDLIARGGLEGLNEAQTQAKIAETAKGTLTPEGQAQVDKLLSLKRVGDEQKYRTGERVAGQDFSKSERLGRQEFDTSERVAGEGFKSGESEKERQQRLLLEKMGITSNEKIANQRDATTRRGQDLDYKSQKENRRLQELLGTRKADAKNDPIDKLGLSKLEEEAFRGMAPEQRAMLLDKDGNLKQNVAWVEIPEKRNEKGQVIRAKSYRFENSQTGKEIPITQFKEAPEDTRNWFQKTLGL